MGTRSAALLAALALACGGTPVTVEEASQKPESTQPPSAAHAPKPNHLTIVPMTITSGADSIRITSEGNIEAKGQSEPVATLRPTGEVFHPNGGLYLTLNSDGSLTGAHLQLGELADIVIDDQGNVSKGGQPMLAIGEGGEILRGTEPVAQIEGPPEGRRAAMLVFLLASLSSAEAAPAEPQPEPAPGP